MQGGKGERVGGESESKGIMYEGMMYEGMMYEGMMYESFRDSPR